MAVETPLPRPEGLVPQRKYTQGQGLGDVELRADLEPYMYGNPLARLGYELFKEGKIRIGAMPIGSSGLLGDYLSPEKAKEKYDSPQGIIRYIQEAKLSKDGKASALTTLVHELTHAGIDVIRANERAKVKNIDLADEYAFEGRRDLTVPGTNPYGGIDYEEGVVRAGDKLIEARAAGGENLSGGATLDNYLGDSPDGPMGNTPENKELLKQRYLNLSREAQNVLEQRGMAPEAISPSDTREKSFKRSFSDFFRTLIGKDKERSKLNYLGFANPSKLNKGGALMAKTGVMPLTEATSNPTGNKPVKQQKLPRAGATRAVDPRDEALKLITRKMKDDKTQIGIPQPKAPTPVVSAEGQTPMPNTGLAAPMMPPQEEQTPTTMKEGGTKSKKGKGLAVVIDMTSSPQPEYEEASKGTPADPPPGATSAEVKDDQHVLLSEGELVVPANVVRYHGLGMYEGLRREALRGLGEMEDAGQVEYVDDDIKSAQAGMSLVNAPNVATQQTYNPALGQFGMAAPPEAASARFLPIPRPPGPIAPPGLKLGPVTNPNMKLVAGNVGSYKDEQKGPGDKDKKDKDKKDDTPAPVSPSKVVQQDSDDGGDPEISAGLGGARATIGGQEYAIQYDFSGNVIGIANVADALSTGRANFFAPNPELAADLSNMTKGQINMLSAGIYGTMTKEGVANRQQTIALADKIKAGNYGGLGMRPQDMPMPRPAGLGASTMPRVGTAPVTPVDRQGLPLTAPVAPVNRQLAFGLGENLGGAFGTNQTDYGLSIDPTTGLQSTQAPRLDITNVANMGIDGPADAANTVSRMGIDGAATTPFQLGFDYSDDMLPDRPQQTIFGSGIDGPADAAAAASRVGTDGAAMRQSAQAFGRPTADLPGVGGIVRSEEQKARDDAFREAAEAKSRKEARDAQMKGIGLGLSADVSAPGTATNEALQGKGYSNYDSQGNPSGAAPAGSQYSATGIFSTSRTDDDPPSDLGGATGAGYGSGTGEGGTQTGDETSVKDTSGDKDLSNTFADDAATSDTGGGKIVCTEMYRQTQLDDWAQAMKIWYVYQKKYLTPIHEVGYHWLFKPFVRGMKVNNMLTNLGAYFATERTKHLKHILTKGKSKDSLFGNVFCKIIHPIVYLVGLAVHKK